MNNLITYIKAIILPVILGTIIGLITSRFMDFNILIRPSFTPPGILFPIVWTILYILMGISYSILKNKNLITNKTNKLYYAQLFVNLAWSILFFILKWRFFAYFWILFLIILVVLMIKEFYKKNKAAGLIQIPYLIWIIFASILNFSIYWLNR